VLRNRNYFLRFRFRLRLLKRVTVPIPAPTFERLRFRFPLMKSYSSGSGTGSVFRLWTVVFKKKCSGLFDVNRCSFFDKKTQFILCLWELLRQFYHGSGTVINYGSGSGRTKLRFRFRPNRITVPAPVPVPAKSYGSYDSGSATLFLSQQITGTSFLISLEL